MKKNIILSKLKKLNGFMVTGTIAGAIGFLFSFTPIPQQGKEWTAPPEAAKEKNPIGSDAASIEAGKTIYKKSCNDCHGKKGKGDGPKSAELDKVPGDFTKADMKKETDGELFWKITQGKKPMPSLKKELTEEQRWQVINYVRSLGK